ncbi:MAG: hypothetical protein P1U65_07055 [Minwuia sp.]|nr:hypothetical protein [Minwuia sp.]
MSSQEDPRIDQLTFPISFLSDAGEHWGELRKANMGFLAALGFLIFAAFSETDALFSTEPAVIHGLYVGGIFVAIYFLRKRNAIKFQIGLEQGDLLTIDEANIRDHMTFQPDTGIFAWRNIESFSFDSEEERLDFKLSAPFSIERKVDRDNDETDATQPSYEGIASRLQYSMDTYHLRNQVHQFRRILAQLGVQEK